MFPIFVAAGWVILLVLLLYIWADVRELAGITKDLKRELLRISLPGRTQPVPRTEMTAAEEKEEEPYEEQHLRAPLKASEEEVLQEVLTEFLG